MLSDRGTWTTYEGEPSVPCSWYFTCRKAHDIRTPVLLPTNTDAECALHSSFCSIKELHTNKRGPPKEGPKAGSLSRAVYMLRLLRHAFHGCSEPSAKPYNPRQSSCNYQRRQDVDRSERYFRKSSNHEFTYNSKSFSLTKALRTSRVYFFKPRSDSRSCRQPLRALSFRLLAYGQVLTLRSLGRPPGVLTWVSLRGPLAPADGVLTGSGTSSVAPSLSAVLTSPPGLAAGALPLRDGVPTWLAGSAFGAFRVLA